MNRDLLTITFDQFKITSPEKGIRMIYRNDKFIGCVESCTATDDVIYAFRKRIEELTQTNAIVDCHINEVMLKNKTCENFAKKFNNLLNKKE